METEDSNKSGIKVYLVCHERAGSGNETEDIKIIGIFHGQEIAEQVVNMLKNKAGFKEYSDGFSIDEYKLDSIFWGEGFEMNP